MDIVSIGPLGGETKKALDDGSGLRKDFLEKTFVKSALGPTAEKIIIQESAAIREHRKKVKEYNVEKKNRKVTYRKRKS